MNEVNFTKLFAYAIATAILVGTYYALVLYPFALDADIKLWLTGLAGAATTFIFGDQVASRTARQVGNATAAAQSNGATITTSSGPPATVTVGPPDPAVDSPDVPPSDG